MTATEKWDDPWFRRLTPQMKLFWIFVLDKCNSAGIWDVDFDLVHFYLGPKISQKEVESALEGRIVALPDGKWFIPKFITFQYKCLSRDNRMHSGIIDTLSHLGLLNDDLSIKGLISPLQGAKDNIKIISSQYQYQDKEEERKKRKNGQPHSSRPALEAIIEFCRSIDVPQSDAEYYEAKWQGNGYTNGGRAIKDWQATIRSHKAAGYLPSQKAPGKSPFKTAMQKADDDFKNWKPPA